LHQLFSRRQTLGMRTGLRIQSRMARRVMSSTRKRKARGQFHSTAGAGTGEAHSRTPIANRSESTDEERGRAAETPSQIPATGWKVFFWRIYQNVSEQRILAIAAGVTFYALLAIFPGIAGLVALYGLFADPSTISKHLTDLSSALPGGAIDVIGDQLQRLTDQGHATLGFAFLFGLVVSIWSANAGVKALFDAPNIVYGERERRSFLKLNAISLAFTCGALLFVLFALGALVVLR
jgi:membrane protein